jgi:hypothetical protein
MNLVSTGGWENCTCIGMLKYDKTKGRQEVWTLEEVLDVVVVCYRIVFNLYSDYLTKKLLKGLETSE